MLVCDYIVEQIDGDYAHLKRVDQPEEELKVVARALLPAEIYEGCELHYELMQYSMNDKAAGYRGYAGVSRTTVSNVINGNTKRVSQSTIDRITAILKEQNYVPHMGSVMLSGHGSRIIGVVLGFSFIHGMQSLQDSFVGEITGTLQVEAENRGYYIMLIGGERIDNV